MRQAVTPDHEEVLFRKMLPWLGRQLEDEFRWLGKPDQKGYASACPGVSSVANPLDGEVRGKQSCLALEHTAISSFLEQRQMSAMFKGLSEAIRATKVKVPTGNEIDVRVELSCLRPGLTKRKIDKLTPKIIDMLGEYYAQVPKNPCQEDAIRGDLLAEPLVWTVGPLKLEVRRYWWLGGRHASFTIVAERTLEAALEKALDDKVNKKARSYDVYKQAGWKAFLVVELTDIQLSRLLHVGEAFRRVAPNYDLSKIDALILVDNTIESALQCCWAYRDGSVRSRKQQFADIQGCYE